MIIKFIKYIFTVCAVFISAFAYSQEYTQVAGAELSDMMNNIINVSSSIESLDCNFKEVKDIAVLSEKQISTGKMYYVKSDKIRWEYLAPRSYLFIVNKGQTVVKNGDRVDRGNSGAALVFKQVGKLILGCVSGKKIVDEKQFNAVYLSNGKNFKIVMTPKDKRMRQMMGEIVFNFSAKDYYIVSIEMKNSSGDITLITLDDKKINVPIDDKVFIL